MEPSSSSLLQIEHLKKEYLSKVILRDLSMQISKGELLCLLGPSGCGKSTLLKILADLETPDAGVIRWQKKDAFSFVFQDAELLPWRTTLENVRLPLELKSKLSKKEQNERSMQALQRVGLEDFAKHFPHEMSGGMKMRTSIARALVSTPTLLFMDEPFSALDEVTRFGLQSQLRKICFEQKLTIVFVTHSILEAVFLADRVVLMSAKEGLLVLDEKINFECERDEGVRQTLRYKNYVTMIGEKMRASLL